MILVLMTIQFNCNVIRTKCTKMMKSMQIVEKIEGLRNHHNNVIYQYDPNRNFQSLVCYFGGDIQNLHETMSQIDSKYCDQYCLESMAKKLGERFSQSDIMVIQPKSYYNQTFSCYSNFVDIKDKFGSPRYDANKMTAYEHLSMLVQNTMERIERNVDQTSNSIPVTLIGFSKGSCVLNQLIRCLCLKSTIDGDNIRIENIYFLDSGHNGNGVWITDPNLVQVLSKLNIKITIAVTAYQIKQKDYLAEEEKCFTNLLSLYNVPFKRTFKDGLMHTYDLQLHFSVIDDLVNGNI